MFRRPRPPRVGPTPGAAKPAPPRHVTLPRNSRADRKCPADRTARRGVTSVEFAVIAPIFFLMVLGLITWSQVYMVQADLTEAARLAVRRGVVEGTTTQQMKDTAVNYLQGVGVSGETANVIINDGNGNVVEAQNVPPFTELTVAVQVPFNSVTWVPAGIQFYVPGVGNITVGPTGTLQGQFTMRRE